MRDIEFRGKGIVSNEWYYGDLISGLKEDKSIVYYIVSQDYEELEQDYGIKLDTCASPEVNPGTIGQYTGLKDKNGKKIFEGDIVLYSKNYKYIVCFGEYNKNPENCAEAIEIGFYLRNIKDKFVKYKEITPLYSIDGIAARFPKHCAVDDSSKESIEKLELEVIGNIYNNPELLKEKL